MTTSDLIAVASLALAVVLALVARHERRRREAIEARVRHAEFTPIIAWSLTMSGYAQPRPDAVTVTLTNAHALALNVNAGIRYEGKEVASKTAIPTLTKEDGPVEFPVPDTSAIAFVPGYDKITVWVRFTNLLGERWESFFGPDGSRIFRLDDPASGLLRRLWRWRPHRIN